MNPLPQAKDPARLARAHVIPFGVFMAFIILLQLVSGVIEWKHPDAPWWRHDPAQFVYPIQCLMALGLLSHYWRNYAFDWSLKWAGVGIVFGVVGIGFWLLPTVLHDAWGMHGPTHGVLKFLGFVERNDGFDPGIFHRATAYWASLLLRFFRAVVVVALVEEIFWRGFLMRFVCDWEGDYWKQPFGRHRWISYLIVTGIFMAAHAPADYAGSFIYGSLTYVLCVWSKNLGACVIMHATANLLMGLYIMATGHYGLW